MSAQGAGSYEPVDRFVVAVEPSDVMIAQRRSSAPVVRAVAEALPFRNASFDAATAFLTVHHWPDQVGGLTEMMRVVRKRCVIFHLDPADNRVLADRRLPSRARRQRRDRVLV
jgi:ubiquinone/menaquinone biosynthesis C-methylase UbiE